jgi:OmpA-OmpF porin, OOP family
MAEVCRQCGAALEEGKAFCTKCGTRRSDASGTSPARRFCTKCGAPLAETKFCTKCGAPADVAAGVSPTAPASVPASAPIAPAAPASTTATANRDAVARSAAAAPVTTVPANATPAVSAPAAPVPAQKSAGIPKVAIAVAAILLVVVVAGIAGIAHVVHRVRQKAAQLQAQAQIQKELSSLTAGANSAQAGKNQADLANALSGTGGAASSGSSAPGSVSNSASGSPSNLAAISATVDAALIPPPLPKPAPIVPVAGTGNPAHDWPLEYERTVGGPEADLVVRTGDINDLGFGWPPRFDPFSGQSTPAHLWPNNDKIPPNAPPGTDRVMVGTGVMPVHMSIQHVAGQADSIAITVLVKPGLPSDGYSGAIGDCFIARDYGMQLEDPHAPIVIASKEEGRQELTRFWAPKCIRERELSMPTPIVLDVGELPGKINAVVVQIFADDFQPRALQSRFQVSLNGTRIPSFEYAINSLDQGGPVGKLLTFQLLPEYWPLLKSGTVKLLIDDPTTHVPDGYAVDFVRILVNPHKFKYQVSFTATVTDADTHKPIAGATVNAALDSASTDRQGKCELNGIPAGLVVATASAPGYDESSVPVDLPVGQSGNADIQLHRHQESTAALEQSIAQTGTATIYGIHFDTGSSKLRADSMPALNAVLGLINGRPGSNWVISGHTDNQGSDALNIPLSKARAESVVSWLTAHGVTASQLVPQGFGATRPVADNATANGRALNRRVEVALAK